MYVMQPNQPPQAPRTAPHPVQSPQFQPTPHFGSEPQVVQPQDYQPPYPPQPYAPGPTVPPMPASGTVAPSTYDFIMNPGKAPKKSLLPGSGGNAMRLLLVVAGVGILLFGGLYVLKSLSSAGGMDKPSMLSVAQDQTELLHLGTLGTQSAVSPDVKNFAFTTKLSFGSIQATFVQYLAKQGYKPSDKDLALKESASTDAALNAALASSTFDPTFTQTMQTELQTYQRDLTTAYAKAGPNGKKILKADYNSAALILAQMASANS